MLKYRKSGTIWCSHTIIQVRLIKNIPPPFKSTMSSTTLAMSLYKVLQQQQSTMPGRVHRSRSWRVGGAFYTHTHTHTHSGRHLRAFSDYGVCMALCVWSIVLGDTRGCKTHRVCPTVHIMTCDVLCERGWWCHLEVPPARHNPLSPPAAVSLLYGKVWLTRSYALTPSHSLTHATHIDTTHPQETFCGPFVVWPHSLLPTGHLIAFSPWGVFQTLCNL